MASITSVAPPSSPIALAVSHGDGQQLQVIDNKTSRRGGDTTSASINPMLLASVCYGSSGALNFLFNREDAKMAPMIMPTQAFLDLLVGYTPSRSTRRRLTVLHASGGVEDVVDQPDLQAVTPLLKGITAEGDTALHVVASHGDNMEFLECARIIVKRYQALLFSLNNKDDTPLHCAARAGHSKMLSCLIEVAISHQRLHQLLRQENMLKETALHDAVRIGSKDIVVRLLATNSDLANYPKEGTSPLYLAISLQKDNIARTLHERSHGNLSYFGPNGGNALHAAILRGTGIMEDLLKWNNSLTTHVDRDGSTPLHFASSFLVSAGFRKLFEANPTPVYQADNNGLFPIHIAASIGAEVTIRFILEKCPSSARLRTAQGRTFLHVAVEERRLNIVSFVCRTPSLAWILNMQDNDGNTALHLAVQAGKLRMFCSLYRNKEVHLNLPNNNGQTPVDLSRSLVLPGMHYIENNERKIHMALTMTDTKHIALRWNEFYEMYNRPLKPEDAIKEAEKVKDLSHMLGIGSVLVATVTFGATFALPGGFIADDHKNKGTPTLAGAFSFDAFMMANALAFICSTMATIVLVFSGSSMVDLRIRKINLGASVLLMASSLTSFSVAFALGVYIVLAPVAFPTAIAVCLLIPLVVLSGNFEYLVKWAILIEPLYVRMSYLAHWKLVCLVVAQLVMAVWPFIVIFGWATIAWKLQNH